MQKKILIISFYLPYPSRGGRKWAKFCKYLFKYNVDFRVLCKTFNDDKFSPWDNDIKDFEDKITRLRSDYFQPTYKKIIVDSVIKKNHFSFK